MLEKKLKTDFLKKLDIIVPKTTCIMLLTCGRLFATPWTVPYQASLSVGFSREAHWSGLPFPFSGIFLTQSSNLRLLPWQEDPLPLSHLGRSVKLHYSVDCKNQTKLAQVLNITQFWKPKAELLSAWMDTKRRRDLETVEWRTGQKEQPLIQEQQIQFTVLQHTCHYRTWNVWAKWSPSIGFQKGWRESKSE